MAVEPFSTSAYRQGGTRDDNAWKWVWDPAAKAGRWQLAGGGDGKAAAPPKRSKVTVQQLEDESRKVEDDRSRQLRRENAQRIKAREEQRLRAEREEHERVQAALEQRKREMRDKRSLITAGPRVKPLDVCFDDVDVPHGRPEEETGGCSERPPPSGAQHGRPAWNAALAPAHQAPRVGFQPASLIPPPPLPQRNPVPPSSRALSRTPSAAAPEPVKRQPSAGVSRPQLAKANRMDTEIEAALARAEAGIEKARAAATAGSSRPATVEDSLEDMASRPPAPRIARGREAFAKGDSCHHDDAADGNISRLASNRSNYQAGITYFDNRTPVSAPQSDVGSVCGSASGGGAYRRKVDALKGEIEGLRRQGSSAASSRLPSPAASVRSGVSTACSARSTHRHQNNSEAPRLVTQRYAKPPSSSSRYSPDRAQGGGGSRGMSRVREGLMRVREQADLMDSLDLDSPVHRRMLKAGAGSNAKRCSPRVQLPHESLTESLDLSGSGQLAGMQKAQDWLHTAVRSALQDAPTNVQPFCGAVSRAVHGDPPSSHRHQQLQQPSVSRGMQNQTRFGRDHQPSAQWTREKSAKSTRQEAWGASNHEACEVDEEEALLLKSLARLDAKLLSAQKLDPAAAYVAACDFVERANGGKQVEQDAYCAGPVVRAKPLDHWNRHDVINKGYGEEEDEGIWGGSCAAGQDKGLRKVGSAPRAVARDRRTRGAKNK